jgi:hypothetical protein
MADLLDHIPPAKRQQANEPSEFIETKLVRHKFNPGKMGRQLAEG